MHNAGYSHETVPNGEGAPRSPLCVRMQRTCMRLDAQVGYRYLNLCPRPVPA